MRVKINLDTTQKMKKFVELANTLPSDIYLSDDNHQFIVNAKSLLGVMYTAEWSNGTWLECNDDKAYRIFNEFIME